MSLADPLVDVRIATWLVMPDCCDLTDSPSRVTLKKGENRWNLEGLLTQRAGKDAVTSTLTVLRTVSGESKIASCCGGGTKAAATARATTCVVPSGCRDTRPAVSSLAGD